MCRDDDRKRARTDDDRGGHHRKQRAGSCSSATSGDSEERQERSERHYMLRVGDEFDGGRYRVVSQLGKGTFGRVVEMVDTATGRPVAVKVVRAIDKYAREAEIECEILQRVLSSLPRADGFPIVTLHRSFECRGHYCLVFDKLGPSLYHALKARKRTESVPRDGDPRGRYFTLRQIAHFARCCFEALSHLHASRLTHTDLKPENILFVEPPARAGELPASDDVTLIDFGGATWAADHHSSVVCTRQYRPPEVTLGLGWGHEVDCWAMGCILVELYTGSVLFATHDEVEHLALMERSLGALPRRMLRAATSKKAEKNFRHGQLRWPERAVDRDSEAHVRAQPRLKEVLSGEERSGAARWPDGLFELHDLVRGLLEYEPNHRTTAAGALRHPFIARRPTSAFPTPAAGAGAAAAPPIPPAPLVTDDGGESSAAGAAR